MVQKEPEQAKQSWARSGRIVPKVRLATSNAGAPFPKGRQPAQEGGGAAKAKNINRIVSQVNLVERCIRTDLSLFLYENVRKNVEACGPLRASKSLSSSHFCATFARN